MATETHRLNDNERANLVAYLDGELNQLEVQSLSNKITASVTARRELESLQKTWELLDYLPRPEPPEDLLGRTVSMARELDTGGGRIAAVAGRAGLIAIRAAIVTAVAASTLAIGYVATRWLWPDPSARLVRDLSIAERLDEYREVGSFEFLKLLEQLPTFAEDAE